MVEIVAKREISLVKLLAENGVPYSEIRRALRKRDVKVNGVRMNEDLPLAAGDKVVAYTRATESEAIILYEDDNVLAADKPKGVESEAFYEKLKIGRELYFVHRLDRNTDGILVFAKTREAEKELIFGFKNRAFKKYYLAEVYGSFEKKSGTLVDYLVKDAEKAEVKIYKIPVKGSVKIETRYKTLKESGGTSLLEVELVTGKTHQIRAHLAFYGHFVIGDGKYGKESVNRLYKAKKQRLSAERIVFHFGGGALSYLDGKTIERKY